jgi:Phage integrase family
VTVFEPTRKKAGIGRLRFHDLRHSYASGLIGPGVHPKVISEQLGHAPVQITMDRYSHLFDRAYADVSTELEAAWSDGEAASTASALQAEAVQIAAGAFHANGGTALEIPGTITD